MRSLRSEVLSATLVLSVPVVIASIFPFGAIGFSAGGDLRRKSRPTMAFVTLTPEEEREAVRTVRTSWQMDEPVVRRLRADLSALTLSDDPRPSILSVSDRVRPELPMVECGRSPFLPSRKAAPPAPIAAEPGTGDEQAFTKAEMLKID